VGGWGKTEKPRRPDLSAEITSALAEQHFKLPMDPLTLRLTSCELSLV
jgi:hypothetical protein